MPEWLERISDKVLTEAGVLAFILFWLCIYSLWENRSIRKQKDKELKDLNDKLYYLGTKTIEQQTVWNATLVRMDDTVEFLANVLDRAGIKVDKKKPDGEKTNA